MGLMKGHRSRRLREAGDLLAVEAIDPSGLAVTREGAFVRVLQITAPNPLILSDEERARIAEGYCHLAARLRADQRLQFYVVSRPVDLASVLAGSRQQVAYNAGEPPSSVEGEGADPLARARWRMYAAMEESLRLHADEHAAVETAFYVVCPFVAARRGKLELLKELIPRRGRFLSGPMRRGLRSHLRAARESLAFTESVRSELDGLSIHSRVINGEEFLGLLWERFNPTTADRGTRKPPAGGEIFGGLDHEVDLAEAQRVAQRLRAAVAQSPLDFESSRHHVEVERDVEQTVWVATTADHTHMGWLMGAMMTREPFTLNVHVRALDRRRERNKLKMRYRRLYAVNRGAESRGRVPDWDRYAQEQESAHLLKDMAGNQRTALFELSIYLTVKARGPEPDLAALGEAVDFCVEALTSTSDAAVNRGAHHQKRLWPATLPLGRDTAGYSRPYATRNVGDCVPLVGTSCGSPQGIPFAFSTPGRTLERINPMDRALDNYSLLIAGKSGSGKTLLTLVLLARFIAHGVGRVFVIDRPIENSHYEPLLALTPKSAHLQIGADDSRWAINSWDTPDQAKVPRAKVAYLISLHGAMMAGERLSILERSQLAAAIREVYTRAHEQGIAARESMLQQVLLDRAAGEAAAGSEEVAAGLRSLSERLGEFCGQGAYAHVFDRETNVPPDSPLVVFDTKQCPEEIAGAVMFMAVEYVTTQTAAYRQEHSRLVGEQGMPLLHMLTVLVIDEAWHKVATPETGIHVARLALQGRHIGLLLMVLTQQLSHLGTEHGMPLLKNCSMAILLQQADQGELEFSQQALGLTDEQAAIIRGLKTVKGRYSEFFWRNGTRGMGKLRLPVGPTEYWAFTSEPHNDVPTRQAAIEAHDDEFWPAIRELAATGVPAGTEG
jgi:hypothetical protein